jgi:hypothetical protein
MESHDKYIIKLMQMSRELIDLAVAGSAEAEDDGCLLLYGMAQDCGYKLNQIASRELELHRGVRDSQREQSGKAGSLKKFEY